MIDMHIVSQKKQRKYIDSYNMEEKNDWCAHCKPKNAKKVYRFLQYGRKKMIDVHAVNKKKVKKVHRFLCARCKKKKKSKESKQKKQRCN